MGKNFDLRTGEVLYHKVGTYNQYDVVPSYETVAFGRVLGTVKTDDILSCFAVLCFDQFVCHTEKKYLMDVCQMENYKKPGPLLLTNALLKHILNNRNALHETLKLDDAKRLRAYTRLEDGKCMLTYLDFKTPKYEDDGIYAAYVPQLKYSSNAMLHSYVYLVDNKGHFLKTSFPQSLRSTDDFSSKSKPYQQPFEAKRVYYADHLKKRVVYHGSNEFLGFQIAKVHTHEFGDCWLIMKDIEINKSEVGDVAKMAINHYKYSKVDTIFTTEHILKYLWYHAREFNKFCNLNTLYGRMCGVSKIVKPLQKDVVNHRTLPDDYRCAMSVINFSKTDEDDVYRMAEFVLADMDGHIVHTDYPFDIFIY